MAIPKQGRMELQSLPLRSFPVNMPFPPNPNELLGIGIRTSDTITHVWNDDDSEYSFVNQDAASISTLFRVLLADPSWVFWNDLCVLLFRGKSFLLQRDAPETVEVRVEFEMDA